MLVPPVSIRPTPPDAVPLMLTVSITPLVAPVTVIVASFAGVSPRKTPLPVVT